MTKRSVAGATKQLNISLPSSLHHRFKAKMALKGRTMQDQIIEWVQKEVRDVPHV